LVRVRLRFEKAIVNQPITSEIILKQGAAINILAAHINQEGGEILAEIEAADAQKVIKAFRDRGVKVEVGELIEVDSDKCIECGACYSLCPVDAIIHKEDASIVFESQKCVGTSCGLCADACPTRAIRLIG
jgi:formate hydrogenlyase subunit 6/NADH:ubiquinone oxidoreductase subunit I